MNTKQAMTLALSKKKITRKYNPATIRSIRKRLLGDKLSIDFQIQFLSENGFEVKREISWQRKRRVKSTEGIADGSN